MKKQETFNAKKQFKESLDYIKESQKYIYIIIGIFIVSGIIGFAFAPHLGFLQELLKDLISQTENLNTFQMIMFILQNNLTSAFSSLIFGIGLGILPIGSALTNGLVIGYVLNLTYQVSGFADWWRLLPHGIFELPAIFISLGLGVKLGLFPFTKEKDKVKELKRRFYQSMNVFLFIILPLLIIAAIIEGLLIGLGF